MTEMTIDRVRTDLLRAAMDIDMCVPESNLVYNAYQWISPVVYCNTYIATLFV